MALATCPGRQVPCAYKEDLGNGWGEPAIHDDGDELDDHVLGGSLRLRIVSHKRVKRSAVPSMQMSQQVLMMVVTIMMVYHGNDDDNAQWQCQ